MDSVEYGRLDTSLVRIQDMMARSSRVMDELMLQVVGRTSITSEIVPVVIKIMDRMGEEVYVQQTLENQLSQQGWCRFSHHIQARCPPNSSIKYLHPRKCWFQVNQTAKEAKQAKWATAEVAKDRQVPRFFSSENMKI